MGYDNGIADRLRAVGLKVIEIDGWKTRGSSTFNPKGSVDHHTAGSSRGNSPSLGVCINGRSDLSGPLCNVFVARDNTCYIVAAGRANHAGKGGWQGLSGNSSVFGIERENVGTSAEPWRADQTETAAKAHAALIGGLASPDKSLVCEHKEWAPRRKSDAHTISGPQMRAAIQAQSNPIEENEDMASAITYEGASGIWITNGVFKFGLAKFQELVDCANNKQVQKDAQGNVVVRVYSEAYVKRLPETNELYQKAGSSDGSGVADSQLQDLAKAVVKELSDAVAAGLS